MKNLFIKHLDPWSNGEGGYDFDFNEPAQTVTAGANNGNIIGVNKFNFNQAAQTFTAAANNGNIIGGAVGVASMVSAPVGAVASVASVIAGFFGNKDNNARDFVDYDRKDRENGLPLGSSFIHWATLQPQDKNEKLQVQNALGYITEYGYTPHIIAQLDVNALIRKWQRNGLEQQAKAIANQIAWLRTNNVSGSFKLQQVAEMMDKARQAQLAQGLAAQPGEENANTTGNTFAQDVRRKEWLVVGIIAIIIVVAVFVFKAKK